MASFGTTFTNFGEYIKQIEGSSDILIKAPFPDVAMEEAVTINEQVNTKKDLGLISNLEKVTKVDSGAGNAPTDTYNPASEKKQFSPVQLETAFYLNYDAFKTTFTERMVKSGYEVTNDITSEGRKVMFDIVLEQTNRAVFTDRKRLAFHGDTSFVSDDIAAVGGQTSSENLLNYNSVDGLMSRIFADATNIGVTTSDAVGTFAQGNAKASKAAQLSYLSDDDNGEISKRSFRALIEGADDRIFTGGEYIYCSQSVFDNYKRFLSNKGTELAHQTTVGGIPTLAYDGIPLIVDRSYDRMRKTDLDNGTVYNKPHFAMLTNKDQLHIGVDSVNAIEDIYMWYNGETKQMTVRVMHKLCTQIAFDDLIRIDA